MNLISIEFCSFSCERWKHTAPTYRPNKSDSDDDSIFSWWVFCIGIVCSMCWPKSGITLSGDNCIKAEVSGADKEFSPWSHVRKICWVHHLLVSFSAALKSDANKSCIEDCDVKQKGESALSCAVLLMSSLNTCGLVYWLCFPELHVDCCYFVWPSQVPKLLLSWRGLTTVQIHVCNRAAACKHRRFMKLSRPFGESSNPWFCRWDIFVDVNALHMQILALDSKSTSLL